MPLQRPPQAPARCLRSSGILRGSTILFIMTAQLNVVGIAEQIEQLEQSIIEVYNQIMTHDESLAAIWYEDLFTEDGSVKGSYLNEATLNILKNDLENVTEDFEEDEIVAE